jgi:hypothetical protein
MAEVIEAPRWQAVGTLIDQNQRDFLAQRRSLAEDISAWFHAVELFRTTQDERMVLREPAADDLRQHKTWIAGLIAEGERLVTEALSRRPSEIAGGIPNVEATLELLYLWQREWHGPRMSEAKRREILKAVFNVEESST